MLNLVYDLRPCAILIISLVKKSGEFSFNMKEI